MRREARAVLFIGLVWLNQTAILAYLDPRISIVERRPSLPYPFTGLYGVGVDERIYFAVSGAILGRSFDPSTLARARGEVPAAFQRTEGGMPYRDVALEYPPVNLPLVLLPRLLGSSFAAYAALFGALMATLLVTSAAVLARLRRELGDRAPGERDAMAMTVVLLVAHGAIAIQRLDALAALLVALLVGAVVRRRHLATGLFAGLLFATKIVPVLLLPVLLVIDHTETRRDARAWGRLAGGLALGAGLGLGFALVVPETITQVVGYHAERGLHAESTLGIARGVASKLSGGAASLHYSFGSVNFDDSASAVLARWAIPLTLGAAAVLTAFVRRHSDHGNRSEGRRARRLVALSYAVLVVLWLGSKVFSPQYLTWGVPLAVGLWGRGRRRVVGWSAAAMGISQLYCRFFYADIVAQTALGLALLVARQACLVALLVVLVGIACEGRTVSVRAAAGEQSTSPGPA